MDIHKNARLTLRRREDLVEYAARGVTLKLAAASFSVTPKTAAKWVHRFRVQGTPGLWDRSSRPHRSPRRTSSSLTEEVIGGLAHPFLPHPKPRLPHPLRFSKGGLLRNLSCRRLAEELALHTVGMPTLSQRTRKNGAPSVWVIQRMGQPQAGLCL